MKSAIELDSTDDEKKPASPLFVKLLNAKKAEHARKVKEKEARQALEGDKLFRIQRVGVRKSK